jgi:hypothetical protein
MFAVSNDQDGYDKERKRNLIDMSDQDCYDWESLIVLLLKLGMSY